MKGLVAGALGSGAGWLTRAVVGEAKRNQRKKKNKNKTNKKKPSCPSDTSRCGSACVKTQTDDTNCGACGVRCEDGLACCDGACRDMRSDPEHCGNCHTVCAAGNSCCASGCRDTSSDERHCGGCGIACAEEEMCVAGECVPCNVCPRGCPHPTVQGAVNAADPGDTIYLCPGAHRGNVTIRKDVTVVGAGSDEGGSTVIGDGLFSAALTVDEHASVTLQDLTLTMDQTSDFSARGLSNSGELTLLRCTVTDFRISGGIHNWSTGELTLRQSKVSRNAVGHSAGQGGGIFNSPAGRVALIESTLSANTAGESGGGIHNEPEGVVVLTDSTVTDNNATIRGGGIANYGDLTLDDSDVRGNRGGGLFNFGSVVLTGSSRVTGNTPTNCQGTTACAP